MRAAVLDIVAEPGQDAEPGDRVRRDAHRRGGGGRPGLAARAWPPGDQVATLVSLSLTPLVITDGLARWDGQSRAGAVRGARDPVRPLHRRRAARWTCRPSWPSPCWTCAARPRSPSGWSGRLRPGPGPRWSRSSARAGRAARCPRPPPGRRAPAPSSGWCRTRAGGGRGRARPALADQVVIADARDPVGARRPRCASAGGPADVTVVCVDVPGCEGGAVLATAQGGTVIFFSMATSFTAAALGAEGLAADVTDAHRQRVRARSRRAGAGPDPDRARGPRPVRGPAGRARSTRAGPGPGRELRGGQLSGQRRRASGGIKAPARPRAGRAGPRAGRGRGPADRRAGQDAQHRGAWSGPCSGWPGWTARTATACPG